MMTEQEVADAIASLYPQDAARVCEGVERLLEKYASVQSSQQPLDHRDAILITYGDGFRDETASPLDCLRRFASDYLSDCVSAIHLLPCFPFTSDDGFSVQDYYAIDPNLGDWQDVARLGDQFELMFDAVVNHISQKSDWFQGFLNGDETYQEYFLVADPDGDYSSVTRPRALPLLHPFQQGDRSVHVWTTFSSDQIDLNYECPDVFLHVLDVLLFYVSKGARFIRLDAIAFIWKEIGTSCMHLPQAHLIVQLYRSLIDRIAPQSVIITETNVPHDENVSYFGDGTNEAHMVYNFTLPPLVMHSLHKQDVTDLTRWAQSLTTPSDKVCFFNFTASHDGVGVRPLRGILDDDAVEDLVEVAKRHGGFVSMRDNGDGTQSPYEINCNYFDFATDPSETTALRVQRFLLTQSVMVTMPGVPGIYYHSLVGSQNDRQAAIDSGINRRVNREKLNVNTLIEELQDEGSLRSAVYRGYREMLRVRRGEPVFDPFAPAEYRSDRGLFIVERKRDGVRLSALHNFSDSPIEVSGFSIEAQDLLSPDSATGSRWEIPPFGFRWIKDRDEA